MTKSYVEQDKVRDQNQATICIGQCAKSSQGRRWMNQTSSQRQKSKPKSQLNKSTEKWSEQWYIRIWISQKFITIIQTKSYGRSTILKKSDVRKLRKSNAYKTQIIIGKMIIEFKHSIRELKEQKITYRSHLELEQIRSNRSEQQRFDRTRLQAINHWFDQLRIGASK